MKVKRFPIGNSRGIRIPAAIIEACGVGEAIDMRIEGDTLVPYAVRHPREGWSEAFAAASPSREDPLLIPDAPSNAFDDEEWTWERSE